MEEFAENNFKFYYFRLIKKETLPKQKTCEGQCTADYAAKYIYRAPRKKMVKFKMS